MLSPSPAGPLTFHCEEPASCGESLSALWLDDGESKGWAVGGGGVVLHYDGTKWMRDDVASAASGGKSLSALWMDPTGSKGWAVGEDGVVLLYDGMKWTPDEAASAATAGYGLSGFRSCASGNWGWAMGDVVLHYDGRKWTREAAGGDSEISGFWLDGTGSRGWAVGRAVGWFRSGGAILRYDGKKWTWDEAASAATGGKVLSAVWLNDSGSQGWAVGAGGLVLHYDGTKWLKDEGASAASRSKSLFALWLDSSGDHGWAVGDGGVVLRYDVTKWTRDDAASASSGGKSLSALWLNPRGRGGWAIGEGGAVLHYDGAKWARDDGASGASKSGTISALWLDKNGSRGWALGGDQFNGGEVLHYDGAKWTRDEAASRASGKELSAVWLDASGSRGWAVGGSPNRGVVLRYDGMTWTRDDAASAASGGKWLRALWMNDDGSRGWAVGGFLGSVVLHYDGTNWTRDEAASAVSGGEDLSAVWFDRSGSQGWAIGDSGVVLHFDGTRWTRDEAASASGAGKKLSALWVDDRGKQGWAAGGGPLNEGGVLLRYDGTKWTLDEAASSASGSKKIDSLWLNHSGGWGWAMGEDGEVLHYDGTKWARDALASSASWGRDLSALWLDDSGSLGWAVGRGVLVMLRAQPVGNVELDPNVVRLSSSVTFRFSNLAPLGTPRVLVLDADSRVLVPDDHYSVRTVMGDNKEFQIYFSSQAAEIAAAHKGHPFQLQVVAEFGDASAPQKVVFTSTRALFIEGSYWLLPYIETAVSVFLINLALVVAAVYSSWARRLVLDPTVRTVLGVGIFRFLLTEPLLVYVPWVRSAIFRDYRLRFATHPQLKKWDEGQYIIPAVKIAGPNDPAADPANDAFKSASPVLHMDASDAEEIRIPRILEEVVARNRAGDRSAWLIEGKSGLGKSSFLQQLARTALHKGLTPMLIPLGSEQTPDQEVVSLMAEWGDLKLSLDTAMNVLDGGGFIVLLDAFNEDLHQSATLKFVRSARKRNVVIITGQFAPKWDQLPMARIELEPFGPEQLRKIMPEAWLERVVNAKHLSNVVGLPISAFLLATYIQRHNSLPASDYAIYSSLSDSLEPEQAQALERTAWELFKCNRQIIRTDDRMRPEFCELAVGDNILTRISDEDGKKILYKFVHERVARFFVARNLAREENTTLAEWHAQLEPGYGKGYWADVLEFLAASFAMDSCEFGEAEFSLQRMTRRYTTFLREAAEFAPKVFSDRLYGQYQRYRAEGRIEGDALFQDWAAAFLADIVSGKRAA